MKKILSILLIIISVSCGNKTTYNNVVLNKTISEKPIIEKPIVKFNVKARYYHDCRWEVVFTNDDFKTEESFMETFDISTSGGKVEYQLIIFDNEQTAVKFARRFTSYKQCKDFNDKVKIKYEQRLEYRKLNPVKKDEYLIPTLAGCEDEKGKEVIIY